LSNHPLDLVILVADKNMQAAVNGILSRPEALEIRNIQWRSHVHPERDPGCFLRGHDFLRPMARQYAHCLLMFDHHGCGQEGKTREGLESIVETGLSQSGWRGRGAAIVLDPELEVWVWSDSPEVARCLGWESRQPRLREWLHGEGLWASDTPKPSDPKSATALALREVRKPRSSAIYARLAEKVSYMRCADPAFSKFKETLRNWFPPAIP
jgi:hypothetical protein